MTIEEQIKAHLQNEFGGYLTDEEIDLFIELHNPYDFVGYDDVSGAEYLAQTYLTGYTQSWFASQLEDAGYYKELA